MPNHYVAVDFTTKGATRVTGALKDIEKQSAKTAAVTSSAFKSSASSTDASLRKYGASLKTAQGGTKGLVAGLGSLGGGASVFAAAGLTTVALGLKSVINAGRDQERAMRLTQAVLQSTGGAAGVTAADVTSLASKLSLLTGVQDDVVQHGENVLLTFRSVRNEAGKGNDIFTQGTKSALDLSAALGQDLQQSVIQIGKALNDPIAGMTALKRVGVSFTESQKEQIKTLTESGHLLEAQKVILGELKAEFGGAAAAAADPFSKLNTSVKELEESLGTAAIPTLSTYVSIASKAVNLISSSSSAGKDNPFVQFAKGAAQLIALGPLSFLGKQKSGTDALTAATKRLDDAQKKLVKDSANAHTPQSVLAADANNVRAAQAGVTAITNRASDALNGNAKSVNTASIAYAGLGANVKNAADALDALNKKAFAGINAQLSKQSAGQNFQDALTQLTNPDTGSSGGGGSSSTESATSQALSRADKEATLRDAVQGVTDADRAAKDAQTALSAARKTYETVLHGVAAGSREAKDAEVAYTQAQDAAKSSALDLRDAHRQLADAIDAQKIASREANEALGSANRSRAGARLDVQDAKANLADAREGGDPEEIARAQLALGEAEQRLRDATESVAEARKARTEAGKKSSKADDDVKRAQIGVTEAQVRNIQTIRDQNEAQRVLNGTLHGFPAASQEAKDALKNYQDALITAREATDSAHDSSRALQRAQADLAGRLDAVGGSAASASKKVGSLASRLNDAKTAGIALAIAAGSADLAIGHSFGHSIQVEIQQLKTLAAANPLLAHAFDTALTTLENQFALVVKAQEQTRVGPPAGNSPYGTDAGGHGPTLPRRAAGGPVPGDDPNGIPILAHPGEYVIQRKAVEKYGVHAMARINDGKALPAFASGGVFRSAPGEGVPHHALTSSRPVTIVQEFHYHHTGPLVGDQVEAWLEKTMASARRNGRDLDRRR